MTIMFASRPPARHAALWRVRPPEIPTSVDRVSATITTADAPDRERYEAHADDALAGILQYRRRPELIALVHTEVLPAFEGQGVGGALARLALEDARASGTAVLPFCPFVNAYIQRHPEYAELVPESLREKFGL
jgi:predicted GNAT family acetyltransferase